MSKTSAWCWGILKWIGVPLAIGAVGFYFVGPIVRGDAVEAVDPAKVEQKDPAVQALQDEPDQDAVSTKFKEPPVDVTVGEATQSRRLRPGPVVRRRDRTRIDDTPEPEPVDESVAAPEITDPESVQPPTSEVPEKPKKKKKKRSTESKPSPRHEQPRSNPEPSPGSSDEAGSGGAATGGGQGDPASGG